MFGIPYEKIVIHSKLEPSEIVDRLTAVTSRFLWFKFPPKEKDFVGSVSTDSFKIYRNIRGRNTYLPWLVGKIHTNNEGSQIVVSMSLHPLSVFVLLAAILYVFGIAFIPSGDIQSIILFCSGVLVFHLVMYLIGFRPEVSRAKKRLKEIFAGE
jgi:hypothetical protein